MVHRREIAPYRQPGNIKLPFWLTPDKYYVGPAWYSRDIVIPAGWKGKDVHLMSGARPLGESGVA